MSRWFSSGSTLRAVAALLVAMCVHVGLAEAQSPERWNDVPRVVVVGDVHGAYTALVDLLQATGVIGADLHWTGGETHLVSLGDLLDRGAGARRVLDLVMRLEEEAAATGGRVHVVLGNHEAMNLLGDLRYVAPADYAAFAADETPAMRAEAYARFAAAAADGDTAATEARFDAAYPAGYFARQAAFAPSGRYGAWLLSLPAVVIVDDTAFMHGGPSALVAEMGLGVNAKVRTDLVRYFELRERLAASGVLKGPDHEHDVEQARAASATAPPELAPVLAEFLAVADAAELGLDGPLWYRGSIYCKPLLETDTLAAAIERLNVARVVVGHTPTGDRRVHSIYDGRLVMLDTGMLTEYFRGRPAALVLENGRLDVQYLAPTERGTIESGNPLEYGRTEAQLYEALERGVVTPAERPEGSEPWPVTVRHGDTEIAAIFIPEASDRAAAFELAAAALDDMLGTALVAPTVARSIEGQDGALQLRYPDTVSEADRVARGLGFSGWCPIDPQLQLLYTFDALTANRGRTAANVLFSNDLTDLTITDERQAFGTERTLPAGLDPSKLKMPARLVDNLRALDETGLRSALGGWLDTRRIRGLLGRRDRLLASRAPP
jgi:hypothetical protein